MQNQNSDTHNTTVININALNNRITLSLFLLCVYKNALHNSSLIRTIIMSILPNNRLRI